MHVNVVNENTFFIKSYFYTRAGRSELASELAILGLQSISRDMADNVSHPRRLDPTMELITYSFVLYLQHGRHDVKCKPSIRITS